MCSAPSAALMLRKKCDGAVHLGRPLRYVRLSPEGGDAVEGVLNEDASCGSAVALWLRGEANYTLFDAAALRRLSPELPAPLCYALELEAEETPPDSVGRVVRHNTGGIGEHVRMEVIYPVGDPRAPAKLFVTDVGGPLDERREHFERAVQSLEPLVHFAGEGRPDESAARDPKRPGSQRNVTRIANTAEAMLDAHLGLLVEAEETARESAPEHHPCYTYVEDEGYTCTLTVRRRRHMQHVIAYLAWSRPHAFPAYCFNEDECKVVAYVPEKLSRCVHMWVDIYQRDAASAGPVRDAWRWRMSHLPRHWLVPYTLPGLAREVAIDLLAQVASGAAAPAPTAALPAPTSESGAAAPAEASAAAEAAIHLAATEQLLSVDLEALEERVRRVALPLRNCVRTQLLQFSENADAQTARREETLHRALRLLEGHSVEMHALSRAAHRWLQAAQCAFEAQDESAPQLAACAHALALEAASEEEQLLRRDGAAACEALRAELTITRRARERIAALRGRCTIGEYSMSVPALSEEQMRQLIHAVYCLDYAPLSEERRERIRAKIFVYHLHGHVGRLLGSYERSGKFRGFGKGLRVFRGEKQGELALAAESLGRVRKDAEGNLVGAGGRGYKGIRPDVAGRYEPKFHLQRKREIDEAAMSDQAILARRYAPAPRLC